MARIAADRAQEAGLQLHRGHRLESADRAAHRQHHRGVCGGHHGLAAQHAAAVHVRRRDRQREHHLARRGAVDAQRELAHPRCEGVALQQRLQRSEIDAWGISGGCGSH
jgi:hypothetical protein